MVSNFHLPPTGFGPGSQPLGEEGEALEYLPMPQDMRAYSPHLPEVEVDDHLEIHGGCCRRAMASRQ